MVLFCGVVSCRCRFSSRRERVYLTDGISLSRRVAQGREREWLQDDRHDGAAPGGGTGMERPLGAVHMGLIYVNPTSASINFPHV